MLISDRVTPGRDKLLSLMSPYLPPQEPSSLSMTVEGFENRASVDVNCEFFFSLKKIYFNWRLITILWWFLKHVY